MTKSILIVDDSQAIRRATRDFIETTTEFAVCGEAVDGIDALDKARALHPDLIILNLAMPRMNGLQAARALRITSRVPIILFTLYASEISSADIIPAGINAVVSKVADLALLAKQVQTLLAAT